MKLSRASARAGVRHAVAWVLATRDVPFLSAVDRDAVVGGATEAPDTGRVSVGAGTRRATTARIVAERGASVDIGTGVVLAPFSRVECHRTAIVIGDGVRLDPHAAIVDWWGPDHPEMPAPQAARVVVGAHAHLGTGCVVGPGVTIGDHARIPPGAAVFVDVPAADCDA